MSDKDIIEDYAKELAKFGQELPVDNTEGTEKLPETVEVKEPIVEEHETEVPETKERVARQLSDKYKEKKAELHSEKELREQAERERDELKIKFETLSKAGTSSEREDATEDAVAYAEKIGADPDLVKRIIEDARKGFESKPDESLQKDLNEFKVWKTQNQQSINKQMFDDEFTKTLPTLKEMFPSANVEEINAIKQSVDAVSHTEDWHDKDLDYIIFKHKEQLGALITPKKRGMETKGRTQTEQQSSDFDPMADVSSMSPKQRASWMKEYEDASFQKKGIYTDSNGKKTII